MNRNQCIKTAFILLFAATFLVGCGKDAISTAETSDVAEVSKENVFALQDINTNEKYGSLILNSDNSIEITLDDSDVTYEGYVEPLDYPQNYHITAVQPHTNFTEIVAGNDMEIYYLDCDILLCDYDEQGNACYFASLFNDYNGSGNAKDPFMAKNGVIPVTGTPKADRPFGYFARFITVVDDNGNELYKIAQNHTSEGFLWSGEISVDGKNFDKDYGLTFSDENGRHVFGSFAKELIFSASNSANYANYAENYDEQANLEITLTCIDEDKGIYTEKKIDYQTVEKYDEPLNDEEQIVEDTPTQEETDTEMLAEETQEDTSSNDNSAADNSSEQKEQPKKSSGGRTTRTDYENLGREGYIPSLEEFLSWDYETRERWGYAYGQSHGWTDDISHLDDYVQMWWFEG